VPEGDEVVNLELEVLEGYAELNEAAAATLVIHEPIGSDGLTPRVALPVATSCPLEGGPAVATRLLLANPGSQKLEARLQLAAAQGYPTEAACCR